MKNCDCYHIKNKKRYIYHPITAAPIRYDAEVGVCYGTKEMDECDCGGDRCKCDFYPEIREKAIVEIVNNNATNNTIIENAINHFAYGVNNDIFKEHVKNYAKVSIEALEKRTPKMVIRDSDDESDYVYCPCCHECIGSNELVWDNFYCRDFKPMYCQECGQAMIWK